MHDAFEHAVILEKLPLQIECIATFGDNLLVGTRQGHLLLYGVKDGTGDNRFEVELRSSNKLFSKKPILQLAVVEQLNLLISLSDNVVSVHTLETFALKFTLHKTKAATVFAVDMKERKQSSVFDPSPPLELKLCVAVKRKLQLFSWRNGEFQELEDLLLPDIAKSVVWSKESLCVGFKREYSLIKTSTGAATELFSTGRHLEPTIATLPSGELILCRDDISIITDSEGKKTQKQTLTWTDTPTELDYVEPYVIGLLPRYVEIRTISPRALIQSIELPKPRYITQGKHMYVASTSHVWRLIPVSIPMQIQQLLQDKQFSLALMLADMVVEPEQEKAKRKESIQNLFAFDMFCQKRFDDSLQLFAQLETDPTQVIGLFPELLPSEFRKQLEYPAPPPQLTAGELEKGCLALVEYLTQKRNDLIKSADKPDSLQKGRSKANSTEENSKADIKAQKNIMHRRQIIDTTLLKCYLQTNDALVAPLLRLKENNCHVEECERVLMRTKKYNELVILYQTKGLHKKALDLLLRQAQKSSGLLKGHQRTVQYLQHLGHEHLKLIFDFSVWVLKAHPDDGLKIFTEDLPEVEGLPRDKVLSHIEQNAKQLTIRYLEHIIFLWNESKPEFHNKLINSYREKVQVLTREYLDSLPEGDEPFPPGSEPGELGELRGRLLFLLETSKHYQAQHLLTHFPETFYHERALLLGRVGRHEEALAIYIHVLRDAKLAEEYCHRNYNEGREGSKDVYVSLLRMYLEPPKISGKENMKPSIVVALNVLQEHRQKISTAKALELLPSSIEVREVYKFLLNVLKDKEKKRKDCQVLKSLLFAEHLQVQEQRMHYQGHKILLTDERACRVCHKKIGNSAFAYYPTGEILHYYCCKNLTSPPSSEHTTPRHSPTPEDNLLQRY
ncbi:Vam6/Vps39-like protein [Desmophyllum pertusum]|uniref:Vam6/Vps39-like protein n=1 Tax=Desmophyllum pertusum TaxID=174260 RepID=A0A9W9YFW0_9CNID|nr:Vam6/Vps39-like protein [Desmophyllum pertusum]